MIHITIIVLTNSMLKIYEGRTYITHKKNCIYLRLRFTYEKLLFFIFRSEQVHSQEHLSTIQHQSPQYALPPQKTQHAPVASNGGSQEKMLSVSGKKKCSHCGEELGNRAET